MSNYICADLKRILFRAPRIIMTLLIYAIMLCVAAFTYYTGWSSINFVNNIQMYILMLPIMLGLVELIAVYSDDFRAKTMQVAIGLGISRAKVVCCKLIEVILLAAIDIAVLAVLILGTAAFLEAGLSVAQNRELLVALLMAGVIIVGYISLTMIVMFYNQGTGLGRIVYLALACGGVSSLVQLTTLIDFLEPLRLDSLTLTHFLDVGRARLLIGIFDVKCFIGILLYIVASTGVTIFLFRKRELEF